MLTKKESIKKEVKTSKAFKSDLSAKPESPPPAHPSAPPSPASAYTPAQAKEVSPMKAEKKKGPKTRIIVRYDVGFSNVLTLRGEGAGLNWNRGVTLTNVKADEWVWESDLAFEECEFKVLINDSLYELGDNHTLQSGRTFSYSPHF